MSATAVALFEPVSPPAAIQNLPQSIKVHQSTGVGTTATVVADPVPLLRDALDGLQIMQERLSTLTIESEQDRALMRESAAKTYEVARLYYDLHAEMTASGLPTNHPVVAMCEDLAAGLEDVAETAALAGSKAFARSVARELADAPTED